MYQSSKLNISIRRFRRRSQGRILLVQSVQNQKKTSYMIRFESSNIKKYEAVDMSIEP